MMEAADTPTVRTMWRRRTRPGAAPGTLLSDPAAVGTEVRVIAYGPERIEERSTTDVAEIAAMVGRWPVVWVNVDGLGDVEFVRRLGDAFGLHRLALEDVVNVHQRPKVEEYEDHLFIVSRAPTAAEAFDSEQVTLFLGAKFLLTFQERAGDCFDPVRERLRRERGRIREAGSDYLAYALLDSIIDSFFPVLEYMGEAIERLEDDVLARPEGGLVGRVHRVKRELLSVRRAIWPQREMLNALIRDDSPFMTEPTRIHLRDCYDHTIQLIDVVETYREIASGLIDIYLSSISTRLNEVMKLLTVISTIFIPLGFIASVYGMNFDRTASPWNMPELGWAFGYPLALALMAAVGFGLLAWFWRRGWVGRPRRKRRRPAE